MLVSVEFDSEFEGFGGYLAGSYSDCKPLIKINISKLLSLVNDPLISSDESKRAELYKYFLSETIIHELQHVLQEALGIEFTEEDIEDALSAERACVLE